MSGQEPSPVSPDPLADDGLAAARGYLLYLAEEHLGPGLHAKAGASDLVQTALLEAHQCADRFRGRTDAERRGWLRRILLNCISKFRRRWAGRGRDHSREVSLCVPLAAADTPADHETPSHLARQREQRQLLAAAIARLAPEQQQVLALRVEEGLCFAEVGQRIGKTADAARMIYNRSLEQLQGLLPTV